MFFWVMELKKKNGVFTTFRGGGAGPKLGKFTTFFFFSNESFPKGRVKENFELITKITQYKIVAVTGVQMTRLSMC